MFPLWIVAVGGFFIVLISSITVPKELSKRSDLVADVTATNMIAYRAAVIDYKNTNPAATGTIADASITFLPGYIRDTRWTNLIQANTLYVYSTAAVAPQAKDKVFDKVGRSLSVGIKGSSGDLISPLGDNTGVILPVSIPTGAITILGD